MMIELGDQSIKAQRVPGYHRHGQYVTKVSGLLFVKTIDPKGEQ